MHEIMRKWHRPRSSSKSKGAKEKAQKALLARKRKTSEEEGPGTSSATPKLPRLEPEPRQVAAGRKKQLTSTQDGGQQGPSAAGPSKMTASRRKIEMFEELLPLSGLRDSENYEPDYIIVSVSELKKIVNSFKCDECRLPLSLVLNEAEGFAQKISVVCLVCETDKCKVWGSDRLKDSSKRPPFSINRQITEAFLTIGLGHAGLSTFSRTMGMNCLSKPSFTDHMKALFNDVQKFKDVVLAESRQMVREAYEAEDSSLKGQPVIDIDVSYDGSWQKKGFTSLYGLGFVIDITTGLVVDFELLSKYCYSCVLSENSLGADSEAFSSWFDEHVSYGSCNRNYSGSSPAMESEGAVRMWRRSEQYGFRFKRMLADGDCKTHALLNQEKPYGPDFIIEKEECLNHISKRVYKNLEELVKKCKATGVTLGGRGEGQLTKNTMSKLSGYYRKAIEQNKDNIPAMKKAIMATIHHCSSTDAKPNHKLCPVGDKSWCFWQKAKAKKKKPASHNEMSVKINSSCLKQILPIYERLSADELLSRCQRGGTQNQNECLHSVVWHKVPKEIFVSKSRLEMGVIHAIADFNMGKRVSMYLASKAKGVILPALSLRQAAQSDQTRITSSETAPSRFQRGERRKKKAEAEAQKKKKEGTSYKAGAF